MKKTATDSEHLTHRVQNTQKDLSPEEEQVLLKALLMLSQKTGKSPESLLEELIRRAKAEEGEISLTE